ncbi:MAG: hypothetical protein CM15mP53_06100 [Ectothiorhodospiraceae bacterium]|nr:MAG: hypothetical protein CM15mP53_06100 [Ectothiorhodospiraceae bacterium]
MLRQTTKQGKWQDKDGIEAIRNAPSGVLRS